MKKKNYKIFIWACDCFQNTGEGKLAILYLNYLYKNLNNTVIEVETPYNKFILNKKFNFQKSHKLNYNFYIKYITPIIGIIKIWINYFKRKKVLYLNYLPLWNPLLFFFMPPGTIFGPVTGGLYKKKIKNLNGFFRKYIFPIVYYINIKILLFRKQRILFSTSLLKNFLNKKFSSKFIFDFQLLYLFGKNIINFKKKKVLLIYYRSHLNKNYNLQNEIIKNLNYKKVNIFGDFYKSSFVRNYRMISSQKLNILLKESSHAIAGLENYASFFILDCYLNKILLINKKIINTSSIILSYKVKKNKNFLKNKTNYYKFYEIVINKINLKKLNSKINSYFKNLF